MSQVARSAASQRPDMGIEAILAAMPDRLSHLARKWAQEAPDSLALMSDRRAVSYRALWSAVQRARTALADAGVRGGDRVLLINETSIAAVVFLLAASELDAWPCLVNARLAGAEIDTFRELTQCRLAVYTVGDSPAAALHAAGDTALLLEDRIFGSVAIGRTDASCQPEPVKPDKSRQVGAVIFTSGTTGKAKAVMLSHQAVMYMGATMAIYRRVRPDDAFYIVVPLSHVIGLGAALFTAFWVGASAELVPRYAPEHLARALLNNRVSHLLGVSTMYRRLIEYGEVHGLDLRSPRLRMLGAGGAPMDLALKRDTEAALGLPLRNSYGMTENNPIARTLEGAADDAIGEIQPGVELRLVDTDGRDVGTGESAEIWVRGPSRMLGYYRDAQATEAALRPGGWLATGDLARSDEAGSLYIVGRSKDVIIRSGFNVYPTEIEGIINQHPDVSASAVVGVPVDGSEEIIAYVQRVAGSRCDAAELAGLVRKYLAAYKRPAKFVVVDALPLGPTGKVLKRDLRVWAKEGRSG
jgi:acyl-CoA synthetase (AMP-forming)/AMP-acid ligase II